VTLLPSNVPESAAAQGIPVGPPPLDDLGLPAELQTRLHNQLHDRGLLTYGDLRRSSHTEIVAALMAALRLDAGRVAALYSAPGGS
jgi:hypothetical protein